MSRKEDDYSNSLDEIVNQQKCIGCKFSVFKGLFSTFSSAVTDCNLMVIIFWYMYFKTLSPGAYVLFITYSTGAYYSELGQLSIFVLPAMAIIGAAVTAFIIYIMSSRKGIKPKRLLLIGIGLNAGLNAFITFFTFRGGVGDYNRVLVWTSGSLWGSGWSYAKVVIPIVALMFIVVLLNHKKLDVLNLSDELAISLGLNLERERKRFLSFAVILAGTATAFAGNIGFLGLVAPHIARKLVGPYHKKFIIVSAMISVIIVILADAVSRNLFSPIEIPVGITVSIFGVPYFIYLMMKEK
mgnify:CR=1 FL=1